MILGAGRVWSVLGCCSVGSGLVPAALTAAVRSTSLRLLRMKQASPLSILQSTEPSAAWTLFTVWGFVPCAPTDPVGPGHGRKGHICRQRCWTLTAGLSVPGWAAQGLGTCDQFHSPPTRGPLAPEGVLQPPSTHAQDRGGWRPGPPHSIALEPASPQLVPASLHLLGLELGSGSPERLCPWPPPAVGQRLHSCPQFYR